MYKEQRGGGGGGGGGGGVSMGVLERLFVDLFLAFMRQTVVCVT